MDIAPTVGHVGRKMYAAHAPSARVNFLRGGAEDLPFPASYFDVVICRLVLPYTYNERAFAEVSRVLRPGGKYLLKISGVRVFPVAKPFKANGCFAMNSDATGSPFRASLRTPTR